jgi:hypothetical protein
MGSFFRPESEYRFGIPTEIRKSGKIRFRLLTLTTGVRKPEITGGDAIGKQPKEGIDCSSSNSLKLSAEGYSISRKEYKMDSDQK